MDLQCHKIYSLTFLLLYMMRVGLFMYPEQRIKALCFTNLPSHNYEEKITSNKLPQAHTQATPFKKCTGRQKDEGRGEATKSFLSKHPRLSKSPSQGKPAFLEETEGITDHSLDPSFFPHGWPRYTSFLFFLLLRTFYFWMFLYVCGFLYFHVESKSPK